METESVKSGHSELSSRSRKLTRPGQTTAHYFGHSATTAIGTPSVVSLGHTGNSIMTTTTTATTTNNHNPFTNSNHVSNRHHNSHRPRHSHRSARSDRFPGAGSIFSASSTNAKERMMDPDVLHNGSVCGGGGGGSGDEVIEVQILPQDDNWGDNTTAITGNTSDHSASGDELRRGDPYGYRFGNNDGMLFRCHRYVGSVVAGVLSCAAFVSPLAMVVIPKMEMFDWKEENLECGPECDSALIGFAFKLLILIVGTWAVFFRAPKATMPRIFIFRAIVLAFVFVFVFSFWLFYGVRVLERRDEVTYYSVVLFAVSLVDALLFIHYLAVVLIELRHLQPQYSVKVVRSPDGESHHYNMGQLSIQRAAVWVLEKYYRDFSIYNPYLDRLPTRSNHSKSSSSTTGGFKLYDVEGLTRTNLSGGGGGHMSRAGAMANNSRRRESSHNERFYEEHEYDRRVRKRRARLLTAAEDAFMHIKRLHEEQGPAIPMDCVEAAQAIFPSMSRALQKYLRITRQQPRHSMESILAHLAQCLSNDLSPKAFLEKYVVTGPVLQNDKEHDPVQTWGLISDILLSRAVEDGTVFRLRQADVSLLVTVNKIPHFNVTEEIVDQKMNKFVLRLNSETSV